MRRWAAGKTSHLRRDIEHGGLRLTASFHLRRLVRAFGGSLGRQPERTIKFGVPGVNAGVQARWGTSDIAVFHSVFLSGHYRALRDVAEATSIIDCGANVGYSSAYLLRQFPNARLVAIEPSPETAQLCRVNLSAFGAQASVVQGAVWPRATRGLALDLGRHGNAEPWAIRVREGDSTASSEVVAVTIPELMERFGFAAIDILKIDIEGSEQQLFEPGTTDWLGYVRNLAVELHDDASRRAFSGAMSAYDHRRVDIGQITFCFDLKARSLAGVG